MSYGCGSMFSSFRRYTSYQPVLRTPEVIQPGSEADIVVTVDASLIPAGKEKTFTFPIIIEGVDARPSDRTLNIKVNYTK